MAETNDAEPVPPEYQDLLRRRAVREGATDPVPIYTAQEAPGSSNLLHLRNALANLHRDRTQDVQIWRDYIEKLPADRPPPDVTDTDSDSEGFLIRHEFSSAIDSGQEDVVRLLIEGGLVSPNAELICFQTPLLSAVFKGKVRVVRTLIELGADRDAFGRVILYGLGVNTRRTPLQLAASMGNLVLVKILIEDYHCDDAIVAPDGQIALRLASQNGHREVVEYLPARRKGGFLRWKHKNWRAIQSIKRACGNSVFFLKIIFWYIPKLFLWDTPKYLVVEPIARGCLWCWRKRREFGPWCKHQAKEMPGRLMRCVKWIGRTLQKIPDAVARMGKEVWKFGTETFPEMIRELSIRAWKLLTVKLPKAIRILVQWIWKGVSALSKATWRGLLKIVSLLSTVVEAVISLFRRLTLKDIWNGICDVLEAILVTFPKLVGSWIRDFGEASYKMMEVLFGSVGVIIWHIGWAIGWIVTYLPTQLWKILESIGGSILKAGHEVKVWINPKTS